LHFFQKEGKSEKKTARETPPLTGRRKKVGQKVIPTSPLEEKKRVSPYEKENEVGGGENAQGPEEEKMGVGFEDFP